MNWNANCSSFYRLIETMSHLGKEYNDCVTISAAPASSSYCDDCVADAKATVSQ
jgi:hypothetical protein